MHGKKPIAIHAEACGESLFDLVRVARREIPDVPAGFWERFIALASKHYGTRRLYVNAIKRRTIEEVAAADPALTHAELAAQLGMGKAYVRRLRKAIKEGTGDDK